MRDGSDLPRGCMPCSVAALVDDLALTLGEDGVSGLRLAIADHRFGDVVSGISADAREGRVALTAAQAERVGELAGPAPFGRPGP